MVSRHLVRQFHQLGQGSFFSRNKALGWVALVVMAALLAAPFAAGACTAGTVRIIVPVAPGGPMDRLARSLAQELALATGQPHAVENRSGGMTIPAWELAARAAPDGCSLLIASTSGRTVLPFQVAKLPFDPAHDLQAITPLADVPQVFVAHPSTGFRSLADVVNKARGRPQSVSIAIPTPGALTHLAAVAFQREAGISLVEVPYRGGAPAALAVRAGEVAMMSADVGAVLPLIKSGDLIALATANAQRLALLPQVPTVAEAGFGELTAVNVYALFAPAGLKADVLQRLHERVAKAMQLPQVSEPLRSIGMQPRLLGPAAFEAELREQEKRLEPIARAAAAAGS